MTTTANGSANDDARAREREECMIDPVERGCVPAWFSRVLTAASLRLGDLRWVDHHGSLEEDGRTCFVSEPYSLCGPASDDLASFISFTRCRLTVTAPGSWHQGTLRLLIAPPPHEDDVRYAEQGNTPSPWPQRYVIYGLADPRDGLFRYVGITTDLKQRVAQHRNGEGLNRQKRAWVEELRSLGTTFGVTTLERVAWDRAKERERYWIVKLRREGHPLLCGEYGRTVNTAPEEWEDLAFVLRAARACLFDAQGKVAKDAGANHPAYGMIQTALRGIDKARCRLDSTLWNLIQDDAVNLVFYGPE